MDPFITTYQMDFVNHPVQGAPITRKVFPKRNCIVDSFKTYLKLSTDGSFEEPDQLHTDYLEGTYKKENPKIAAKYFETPINEDVVRQHLHKRSTESTYKGDYCGKRTPIHEDERLQDNKAPLGLDLGLAQGFVGKLKESEYQDRIGRLGQFIVEHRVYGD